MSVSFQAGSSEQGRAFEAAAVVALKAGGWNVIGERTRPDPDFPEIDIVAEDPSGVLWWIEAKGSWRNNPGLERGDTVKKLIGVAYDLLPLRMEMSQDGETPIPYMVITSHQPREGTLGASQLRRALLSGALNEVRVLSFEGWK